MTTQEKINAIIKEQYGDYKGRLTLRFKNLHNILRKVVGDDEFLKFITESKKANPMPKYKIPDSLKTHLKL